MRHLLLSFLGTGVIQAFNLASGILAARLLLPEGRGELAAVILWPTIIATIGFGSLDQAIAYFTAKRREDAGRILFLGLATAGAFAVASVAAGFALLPYGLRRYDSEVLALARLYLVFVPLNFLSMTIAAYFQGTLRFVEWNAIRIIPPVAYVAGILAFAALGAPGVEEFALASLGGAGLASAAGLAFLARRPPAALRPSRRDLPTMLRYSAGVHLQAIIATANGRLDQILIALLLPAAELGYFVVAGAVAGGVALISGTVVPVAFPKIAAQAETAGRAMVLGRYLRLVCALCGGAAVVVAVLADPIVRLLFGPAFGPATLVAQIAALGAAAIAVKSVLVAGLKAERRLAAVNKIELLVLVATVAGLAALVPPFGIYGAAAANTLARVVGAVAVAGAAVRTFRVSLRTLFVPTREDWMLIREKLAPAPRGR